MESAEGHLEPQYKTKCQILIMGKLVPQALKTKHIIQIINMVALPRFHAIYFTLFLLLAALCLSNHLKTQGSTLKMPTDYRFRLPPGYYLTNACVCAKS